jgi:hypothetical protein
MQGKLQPPSLPTQNTKPKPKEPKLLPGLEESNRIENVISEGPDWNSAPKPKGVATLTLGGETKVYIPGLGWQFPTTARRWARAQGYENWNKIPNPSQPPKPPKPQQTGRPASRQSAQSAQPVPPATTQSAQPATTQSAQPATTQSTKPTPPATPKPSPQPAKPTPSPTSEPIEKRISKVTGNPVYVGTTSSGEKFERRAATRSELDAAIKAREDAKKAGLGKSGIEKAAVTAAISASKTQTEEKMDAFDLVLDYLVSEGHADTLDEALYVMMEMDSETIQSVCEARYGTSKGRKRLAKKVRAGKNIGKKGPGTGFAAVEKAAKAGGASNPQAVAAAAMWKTYGGKK